MAHRLRQAVKRGAQVSFIGSAGADPLFSVHEQLMAAPSALPGAVAEVLVGALQAAGNAVPDALAGVAPSEQANLLAASLASGQKEAVLMGNIAVAFGPALLTAATALSFSSARP